jgi:Rad3-related DNA helicase
VRDNCTKYWPESKEALTRCPYWTEKVNCLNNFASVHNYSYLITESNYVGEFTKKKVLISDEGHNIEGQLINFIKLPITQDHLDKVNKFLDSGNKFSFQRTGLNTPNFEKLQIHAQWVEKLNGSIVIAIEKIKSLAKQALTEKEYLEYEFKNASDKDKGNIGEMIDGKLKRLDDLQGDLKSLESLQENQIAFFLRDIAESLDNWVVYEQYSKTGAIEKIEFQPIRVSKYAYDKYLRLGDLNIIMSATILDYTRVASDLGIDLKEAHYIEIEPPFPAERHKIFNLGIADFGYCQTETKQQKDEFYRQVVERIDSILDLFPEERGIIHATTYEITSYLKHNSKHCNRLTFHGSKDRSQKLEEHKQKKGSVLVSPSMTEGVDLKGEFSKFQILIKVPFPDLSDERIKKRKAVDPASYNFRTANTIIQSIGRSVRSEKDECITFTLDSRFGGFCQWNYKMMKLFNRHIRPNSDLVKLFGAENARNLVKPIARGSKDKVKAYVKPY